MPFALLAAVATSRSRARRLTSSSPGVTAAPSLPLVAEATCGSCTPPPPTRRARSAVVTMAGWTVGNNFHSAGTLEYDYRRRGKGCHDLPHLCVTPVVTPVRPHQAASAHILPPEPSPLPRVCRIRSTVSSPSAHHTNANPANRPAGSGSWRRKAPSRNCIDGVRYCSRPRVVNGTRVAAAPKQSSGTAVTTPAPIRSSEWPIDHVPKLPRPVAASATRYPAAGSTITAVSMDCVSTAPAFTFFLRKP